MDLAAEPLMEITVRATTAAGQPTLDQAIARFAVETTTARVIVDRRRDDIVIKGTSEIDLDRVVRNIMHEAKVELDIGVPRVCYRETITQPVEIAYTHAALTSGGAGEYARVKLRFEPTGPGAGYTFESAVIGGTVPAQYIPGVASGLAEARATGVLAGWPVIGLKVTLTDGAYHDVDSSVHAFETAARAAFREGVMKAAPCLLEPVMKVEIGTPAAHLDEILDDLKRRRGNIVEAGGNGDARMIRAMVPLADMLGYARTIQRLSRGCASLVMSFSHDAPVPPPDDSPFRPAAGMRA